MRAGTIFQYNIIAIFTVTIQYRYSPFGYSYACKGQGSGMILVCMLRTSS